MDYQVSSVWQRLKPHKSFLFLVALFLLLSFSFSSNFENKKLWGDENNYLSEAHTQQLMTGYFPSLLPGAMEYRWWPPFPFSFYALFKIESLADYYTGLQKGNNGNIDQGKKLFLERLVIVNTLLLLIAGAAIYRIALLAGLGKSWSVFATGLVLINPRILFYEQALWPEPLHLALFSNAIMLFILFLGRQSNYYLVISSLLFGYCTLTKGISGIYTLMLSCLLLYVFAKNVSVARMISILLLFLTPYVLLTHAQKIKNYNTHNHYSLSSNTWINIEMGLSPYDLPLAEGYKNVYDRYFSAAETFKDREIESKKRVIDFVRREPLGNILSNQFRNYVSLLNRSFFKWGLERDRWANTNSLRSLEFICIAVSWFLFLTGVTGLLRFMFSNSTTTTLSLFLIYYLSAMVIVGFSPRIFVPAIPFLAIFTALIIKQMFDRPLRLPNIGVSQLRNRP